jgi:hypothetical protein
MRIKSMFFYPYSEVTCDVGLSVFAFVMINLGVP